MKKKYPSQEPERVKEANRLYREKNKEKLLAYDRARYAQRYAERKLLPPDPIAMEAARERTRQWRLKNPERSREAARRWALAHPNYVAPCDRDPDYVNAQWRAAYAKRAEYYRQKAREKRVRKAGAVGSHTTAEWQKLVATFRHACVYCGEVAPLTRDHVIPLSRSELSPTDDISNILPACRPCNSRKKDKTDWEYRLWLYESGKGPVCSQSA